jgi:hypothetical protein
MHENRETSETPAAQSGSTSAGEGPGRTARMHVPEESHSGVLPMNHSNKDGKPLAESAEERPLIKENARQPNTYPTQSGNGVSQGLAGVRKAAKDRPNLQQQSPVRVGDFGPGLWTFLSRSRRLRPSLLSGTVPPSRSRLFVACDFRARRFLARETPNTTVRSCAACTLNNRVDCVDA